VALDVTDLSERAAGLGISGALVRCCCPEKIELSYAKKREFDFDRGRNQFQRENKIYHQMSVILREVEHVNPSTKDQHPPQGLGAIFRVGDKFVDGWCKR
jgi:hypothetical protein